MKPTIRKDGRQWVLTYTTPLGDLRIMRWLRWASAFEFLVEVDTAGYVRR